MEANGSIATSVSPSTAWRLHTHIRNAHAHTHTKTRAHIAYLQPDTDDRNITSLNRFYPRPSLRLGRTKSMVPQAQSAQ
eukprot:12244076-Alexandrium_andersonii.AAC.1